VSSNGGASHPQLNLQVAAWLPAQRLEVLDEHRGARLLRRGHQQADTGELALARRRGGAQRERTRAQCRRHRTPPPHSIISAAGERHLSNSLQRHGSSERRDASQHSPAVHRFLRLSPN
jgi:hypothetical protein